MKGNAYIGVSGSHPIVGGLSGSGSVGLENGAFGNWKKDWSLGLALDVASFTIGATYGDSARNGGDPNGKPGLVLSVSRGSYFLEARRNNNPCLHG